MQINWNKRNFLHKKGVQLPQDLFRTPTWLPFLRFGTQLWLPCRRVKTLDRSLRVNRCYQHVLWLLVYGCNTKSKLALLPDVLDITSTRYYRKKARTISSMLGLSSGLTSSALCHRVPALHGIILENDAGFDLCLASQPSPSYGPSTELITIRWLRFNWLNDE